MPLPKKIRPPKERAVGLPNSVKAYEQYKKAHPHSRLNFEKFQQNYFMLVATDASLSGVTRVTGAGRKTLHNIITHFGGRSRDEIKAIGRRATTMASSIESRPELVKAVVADLKKKKPIKHIAKKYGLDIVTVMKIRADHTSITPEEAQRIGRLAATKKRIGVNPKTVRAKLKELNPKGEYAYSVGDIAKRYGVDVNFVRKESRKVGRTSENNFRIGYRTKVMKRLAIDKLFDQGFSDNDIARKLRGIEVTLDYVKKRRAVRLEILRRQMATGKLRPPLKRKSRKIT